MRKRTFSMDSALESKTQRSITTIVPQPLGPGPTKSDFFLFSDINWGQLGAIGCKLALFVHLSYFHYEPLSTSTTAYLNHHHHLHVPNSTPRSVPRIAHGACNVTAFSSLLKPLPDLIRPPCVSIIQPSETPRQQSHSQCRQYQQKNQLGEFLQKTMKNIKLCQGTHPMR